MTPPAAKGIAIVGCGGMGSWHARNLVAQPGLRVVGAADPVVEAARAVADFVGGRVDDAHSLIAADDVEAVLVASNDETHAEFAIAAIEAGKQCFLEKPIGTTVEQAQAVVDAELRAGHRMVRVGFMRELDPAHAQVAESLRQLGQITRVRCVHRNVDDVPRNVDLLFAQSLIHDIHTIRWLSGQEFTQVTVHVATREDGFRDLLLVGHLSGGAIATIDFEDAAFAYEVQVEVTATGGMAATLPHPRSVVRAEATESISVGTDWFRRFEDAYRLEIEEWSRGLVLDEPSGPSTWDGYVAQVVARAGEVATFSGSPAAVEFPVRPAIYGASQ